MSKQPQRYIFLAFWWEAFLLIVRHLKGLILSVYLIPGREIPLIVWKKLSAAESVIPDTKSVMINSLW